MSETKHERERDGYTIQWDSDEAKQGTDGHGLIVHVDKNTISFEWVGEGTIDVAAAKRLAEEAYDYIYFDDYAEL